MDKNQYVTCNLKPSGSKIFVFYILFIIKCVRADDADTSPFKFNDDVVSTAYGFVLGTFIPSANSSYQTNTVLAIVGFLLIRITFYAKSRLNRVGMLAYLVSEIDCVGSISCEEFVKVYGNNGATNNTISRDTNGLDQDNTKISDDNKVKACNNDSTSSTNSENTINIEAYLCDVDKNVDFKVNLNVKYSQPG
ncbi:7848_t:CDS:2 [Racocetra fulgida]|uniref:7848_t:CDS:1 n=1 Tax=Racocetra fulgida TaxID=60492 RepID=A0A9N9ARN9_9GLOM|nr:7848_t:CDS:2 [Racocetra fulgida]